MIRFPDGMDDGDWALTESKGWLEVQVRLAGDTRTITCYDPARLAQEIHDALARTGYFAEGEIVVVPVVTRNAITAAVTRHLAEQPAAERRRT